MMRNLWRAAVAACVVAVWVPASARAQAMAASFDELGSVLRVGDIVYLVDSAGTTTWGRVDHLSESSLTLTVMTKSPDRDAVLVTSEKRHFTRDRVALITRSDTAGREAAPVYPPSWDKVHDLPPNTDITVVLDTGERRSYRLAGAHADALRLLSSNGAEETIEKTRIRRVNRHAVDDSRVNGLLAGAAAGAGTAFAFTAAMYAQCDAGCEAPAYGEIFPVAMAFGAGIGAAVGWLLDSIHKGTAQVFPAPPVRSARIAVSPLLSRHQRGLRITLAF